MSNQREQDADYFYSTDDLCEMTGYTPKRLKEIARRYRRRPDADGRFRRCFYLKEAGIFNDDFSDWLLEGRYSAPIEVEQQADAVSLKKIAETGREVGLSYKTLRNLVHSGKLSAWVYYGRYYVKREDADLLLEHWRFAQAPEDWLPVTTLAELCQGLRKVRAVYSWAARQADEGTFRKQTFCLPGRSQLALFIPVVDALAYLKKAFGNARRAYLALTKRVPKYFRSLRKVALDLFGTREQPGRLDPNNLGVTLAFTEPQLPPLNSSRPGHGGLQLRT